MMMHIMNFIEFNKSFVEFPQKIKSYKADDKAIIMQLLQSLTRKIKNFIKKHKRRHVTNDVIR